MNEGDFYKARVAVAREINFPDGRRIWVPPRGRPRWTHTSLRSVDLTDEELRKYGLGELVK